MKSQNAPLYSASIKEEELKLKVGKDWFCGFDTTKIIGNVDFCVAIPATDLQLCDAESVLWAEAKKGTKSDIYESLVQLILTIGKERTFDAYLPPKFLGAFDAEKIAFIPYDAVMEVFCQNDFNWNVTPSDHQTKEFVQLHGLVKETIDRELFKYDFASDGKELKKFIAKNFSAGSGKVNKIRITKNNFTHIYQKWRVEVLPTIEFPDWEAAKKVGIIDADFFLADILSSENLNLTRRLNVLLQSDHYKQANGTNQLGQDLFTDIPFNDKQKAHTQFWNRYRRPPKREYWDVIVSRRDLLVPQDVRERKGSFFTPKKWVELSQHYFELAFGEDWQDRYYVWDCCAGTGNLLAGLTNMNNIWASTLDLADVDAMHERIKFMNGNGAEGQGANLWDNHVFRFDFLNDPLDKLPKGLRQIIENPEERKKLIVYMNPPYAEAGSSGKKQSKVGVSNTTQAHGKFFADAAKYAKRELYAQFLARIYSEIKGCKIGEFSTLKAMSGPYFKPFRQLFRAKFLRGFITPGNTFDNVKGAFPIGFKIWDTDEEEVFEAAELDVYDATAQYIGKKGVYSYDDAKPLNDWLRPTWNTESTAIGYLVCNGNDFQHQKEIVIYGKRSNETSTFFKPITAENLIKSCIYLAVRKCIAADWQNDRDQFLFPNDGWEEDEMFQSDCLAFALFENVVKTEQGTNHWIPFTEKEVGSGNCFDSHFMTEFISGKRKMAYDDLFAKETIGKQLQFSSVACAVFDAGRELWRYYHAQPKANPNASYYDIRKHFQGMKQTSSGKEQMNATSGDAKYNELLNRLKKSLKALAAQIAPKVYDYGFLRK